MNLAMRVALFVALAAPLSACESVNSLLSYDDPEPAVVASAEPAPVAGVRQPPDDRFCKAVADGLAQPPASPNLYTPEARIKVREREYAQCMANSANGP